MLFLIFLGNSIVFSQCATEVEIAEGETIARCFNVPNYLNSTPGLSNYFWSGAATGTGNLGTVTGSGWAFVEAEDATNCISKDSIFITFWPITLNPEITSSNGLEICPGSHSRLTVDAFNPVAYEWSSGSTSNTIDISGPGEYWVKVYDVNNCFMIDTIIIQPTVFNVETIGGTAICNGQSMDLKASGGTSYSWSTGQTQAQITVSPTTTTTYQVTIEHGACIETHAVEVVVNQLPPIDMVDRLFLMPGEIQYLTAPAGLSSYLWQPAALVSSETGSTTSYIGAESGTITFMGIDQETQCVVNHSVIVELINLTIPDGFSPNGDGKNDRFVIPEVVPYEAQLKVWNRWGDIVFESNAYNNEWDGTCQSDRCMGKGDLPDGTYFYTLVVKGNTITGNITLKR